MRISVTIKLESRSDDPTVPPFSSKRRYSREFELPDPAAPVVLYVDEIFELIAEHCQKRLKAED